MTHPDFTEKEELLIAQVNVGGEEGDWYWLWQDLAYLIPSTIIVILGAVYQNLQAVIVAFLVVVFFRLRAIFYQRKHRPLWKSVIEKYEVALQRKDISEAQ